MTREGGVRSEPELYWTGKVPARDHKIIQCNVYWRAHNGCARHVNKHTVMKTHYEKAYLVL
jgi:hypothetical protein